MDQHGYGRYIPTQFNFTETQLRKIEQGIRMRVAHHQIGNGSHILYLLPELSFKVSRACSNGKGVELHDYLM